MRTATDEHAADELARAARLERLANDLVIEARAIRARYGKQRKRSGHVDFVKLAKSIQGRAG